MKSLNDSKSHDFVIYFRIFLKLFFLSYIKMYIDLNADQLKKSGKDGT